MSIMEAIRTYFAACPILPQGPLEVDFLGAEPGSFAILPQGGGGCLRRYADGSGLFAYDFAFAARVDGAAGTQEALRRNAFFRELATWIARENALGNLPHLPGTCVPQTLTVTRLGHPAEAGDRQARYEMTCRLTYYQKEDFSCQIQ